MDDRDPVSVLLPTVEWNTACERLAAQLRPGDELLVLCDTTADLVADRDPSDGVEIHVAGELEGCSGKANALAAGMSEASNNRFVWTDDDFHHDDNWLDRLVAAGEEHGPASAVPFFTGTGWWRLFEPWHGALFALLFYFQVGAVADTAWGGGVTFTRSELTVSVPTLVEELRTVLSDDNLLTNRLPSVHAVQSMVTHVEVPGGADAVRHRLIRFGRIAGVNEGWAEGVVINAVLWTAGVAFPIVVAPLATVGFALLYVRLDLGTPNFAFAYPGLVVLPVVTAAAMSVTEFEWGGRRYQFPDSGVVTVLDSRYGSEGE